MEILLEIVFGIWTELMLFIVPEEKATSKKYRVLAIILAVLAIFGVMALFIWGGVLLERGNIKGIIPIVIAVLISITQIIAGMILHKRNGF